MKRYIKSSESIKQYSVEVYPKRSNKIIDSWVLEANSQKAAKDFGYDVLAGYTLDNLFADKKEFDSLKSKIQNKYNINDYTTIGYNIAETEFKIVVTKE